MVRVRRKIDLGHPPLVHAQARGICREKTAGLGDLIERVVARAVAVRVVAARAHLGRRGEELRGVVGDVLVRRRVRLRNRDRVHVGHAEEGAPAFGHPALLRRREETLLAQMGEPSYPRLLQRSAGDDGAGAEVMVDVLARRRRERLPFLEAKSRAQGEVGASDLNREVGEVLRALVVVAADVRPGASRATVAESPATIAASRSSAQRPTIVSTCRPPASW